MLFFLKTPEFHVVHKNVIQTFPTEQLDKWHTFDFLALKSGCCFLVLLTKYALDMQALVYSIYWPQGIVFTVQKNER